MVHNIIIINKKEDKLDDIIKKVELIKAMLEFTTSVIAITILLRKGEIKIPLTITLLYLNLIVYGIFKSGN